MALLDLSGWLGQLLPQLDPNSDTPVSDWLVGTRFKDRFAPAEANPLQFYQQETRRTVPDVLAPVAATQEMMARPQVQPTVAAPTPQQLVQPPPPQQMPQPQQDSQFGNLNAGLQNFIDPDASFVGRIVNGLGGLATGKRTDAAGITQQNQLNTARSLSAYFRSQGMAPQQADHLAILGASNPKLIEDIMKPPATIEAGIARGYGPGAGPAGLDKLRQLKQEEARGTKMGQEQAVAAQAEPAGIQNAKDAASIASRLLTHPGRDNSLFWHSTAAGLLDDATAQRLSGGTEAGDALGLHNQLTSQAFLEAYQNTLKGGGQITEIEGVKGTQALLRARRALTKAEYDQSIRDFISHTNRAIDNFQFRAGHADPNYKGALEIKPGSKFDWVPGRGLVPRQ